MCATSSRLYHEDVVDVRERERQRQRERERERQTQRERERDRERQRERERNVAHLADIGELRVLLEQSLPSVLGPVLP